MINSLKTLSRRRPLKVESLETRILLAYDLVDSLYSDGQSSQSQFGISLALDDYLVVGAAGAEQAYVYNSDGTELIDTLESPATSQAFYGEAVATSGSFIAVGARLDDTAGADSGAVYVYDFSDATPDEPIASIYNPTPSSFDFFGNSIAIDGPLLVVGADRDGTSASSAGIAYVYNLSSSNPTVPATTLFNPNPASNDFFGSSVAIFGTNVVVGASGDDGAASGSGAAYLFDISGGVASDAVPLRYPNASDSARFGTSIAQRGSLFVVGASRDDTGANNSGAAFVYDIASATPDVPIEELYNPAPDAFDGFGGAVAIDGTHVVIGATGNDTVDGGSSYVFELANDPVGEPFDSLHNPTPVAMERFGGAVVVSGQRIFVSDYWDDFQGAQQGALYHYEESATNSGDFNQDGEYDCADIDLLIMEIGSGNNDAQYDLTGDSIVDLSDRDAWLVEAGQANLPSQNSYLVGDGNLDGVVDVGDFNVWNENKFTAVSGWCSGDFNADLVVDVGDFNDWNENKFTSALTPTSQQSNHFVDLSHESVTIVHEASRSFFPNSKPSLLLKTHQHREVIDRIYSIWS